MCTTGKFKPPWTSFSKNFTTTKTKKKATSGTVRKETSKKISATPSESDSRGSLRGLRWSRVCGRRQRSWKRQKVCWHLFLYFKPKIYHLPNFLSASPPSSTQTYLPFLLTVCPHPLKHIAIVVSVYSPPMKLIPTKSSLVNVLIAEL